MMVAGADKLCEWVANAEGHPGCALADVTTGDRLIDGKDPDIVMTRFRKDYGAYYHITTRDGGAPILVTEDRDIEIPNAWICPVTLLILGRYPKRINIYIK